MNKIIMFLLLFTFALPACAANTSNYGEQGGARTVIGGSLDVISGGDLDVESGGSLKIGGTAITATAAELNASADASSQASDGVLSRKVVRVTYDFAVDGGATSTIDLGQDLPALATVTRVDAYVVTQIVDGGAGTIALECEDSANLEGATDHSGVSAGGFITMDVTGAVSTYVTGIAAQCNISIVIAGAAITAGKVVFYVSYYVAE